MEKLSIKLKELSPIVISLIEKIQSLDSDVTSKQEKISCTKEMLEVVDEFHEFFVKALNSIENNEHIKIFSDRIERAFSRFDWDINVAASPLTFQKYSENGKVLISSILKLLGTKGCGILIIETYLKLCNKIINEMIGAENSNQSKDMSDFKLLLEGIITTINILKKYWHLALLPNQKNLITLCLSQVSKGLRFLLKMIELDNSCIKLFALKRLGQCFDKMMEGIHCDGNFQDRDYSQEFISLMNFSLLKINEMVNDMTDFSSFIQKAKDCITLLEQMIDEILYYAMSLAQVTQDEDHKKVIMCGSLKILRDLKDLKVHIDDEDGCGIKLNAQSLGESLCQLERQLNSTVMHLVLDVFTGINCPLKNIVNKCRTDIQKDNKASDDLNMLISEFDVEMDKIMQIGFFAISCSSDLNRTLGIRSCLASFESLEAELISSLAALYMDCSHKTKLNFQHLIDLWLNEMSELKVFIDSIMDPAGFCEVVEKEINNLVVEFKKSLDSDKCFSKANNVLNKIIRYSRKLIRTVRTSLKDEENVLDDTEQCLKNFQLGVQECEAVSKLLESEEDVERTTDRAHKRAEYLMEKLRKLASHLFDLVSKSGSGSDPEDDSSESTVHLNIEIPQKNYYKLCDSSKGTPESNSVDVEFLTPYINKGILRSKRRNILYTTPSDSQEVARNDFERTPLLAKNWDKTPISRKRSRCCKPLNINLQLGNSVDFEITSVLENLSHLSASFNRSRVPGSETVEKDDAKETKIKRDATSETPALKSTGCHANLSLSQNEYVSRRADYSGLSQSNDILLGSRLRHNFLKSLNELSQSASISLSKGTDGIGEYDTPGRLNDLKIVDEKINFLKQQVPCILP